jgi:hypothetical protein
MTSRSARMHASVAPGDPLAQISEATDLVTTRSNLGRVVLRTQ